MHLDNDISNIREQWTLMVRDDNNQTLIIYLHLLIVIISILSQPSSLRLDPIYIKLYLLCTNLAINGIIPATLLITLNLLTFLQVLDFKKVTSSSSSTSSESSPSSSSSSSSLPSSSSWCCPGAESCSLASDETGKRSGACHS